MQPNDHIREFLRYYCTLSGSPTYGVLLTGLWGSGKTWFIKNFLDNQYADPKAYLYVSLYGMRSVDDIESEYFRQLHPILSSKGARVLGKLAKGILKTSINFDFDADGKPDGNISAGIPSESLFERIKLTDDKLLVFDDLERSTIPVAELLGYINQYIEHGDFKVIMLSNEAEILKHENSEGANENQAYTRIKEKVIGRSFEVLPELDDALQHFSKELPSTETKNFIKSNLDVVSRIYNNSGFKNLRILRHSLWDFDRICGVIDGELKKSQPAMLDVLHTFLSYSLEIRSGNIKPCDLSKISATSYYSILLDSSDAQANDKFKDIRAKYPSLEAHQGILPTEIWESFFQTGAIPTESINEALRNSKHFQSSERPNWVKCWHGIDLLDEQFEESLELMSQEWRTKQYTDPGVVLHVFGLLLEYGSAGIVEIQPNALVEDTKEYLKKLMNEGHIKPISGFEHAILGRTGYAGLGFNSVERAEFIAVMEYLSGLRSQAIINSYPEEANKLLKLIETDADLFLHSLILSNSKENKFYKTPILRYIAPIKFIEALMRASPTNRRTVSYAFPERYKYHEFQSALAEEAPWLAEVISLLENEISRLHGKISGFSLEKFILPQFKEGLNHLEANKDKASN